MPRGSLKVAMDFEVTGNAEARLTKLKMKMDDNKKAIQDMEKAADKAANGGFKNLAGAYNALIVAGRISGAIKAGIKPAMEMEEAMMRLSVTTGATKEEQKLLAKAARDAAAQTPFDPAEAIDAMTNVHLATGDVKTSMQTLIPVMQMASTFLGRDTKKASQMAGDLIRSFGLGARDAALALDMMATAAQFTRTRVDDMTGGVRKFGIVASIAGTSFDDVLKVFTLAQGSFRNAEANMTGLQRVVQRFSRPELAGNIEKYLGVGVIDQATGRMRKLSSIVLDLANAANNNQDQWAKFVDIMSTTAEARAVKPIVAAVNTLRRMSKDGKDVNQVMATFQSQLLGAESKLTGLTDKAMAPLGQQLLLLGDAFFKLLEAAFSPLLHAITPMVTGLQKFANVVSWLLNDIPGLSGALSTAVGLLLGIAITAGIAKTASLAFAAVQAVTAMANHWLKEQTEMVTAAQLQQAGAAGIATKSNTRLGRALIGLRVIGQSLRSVFSSMWRALTGPVGWLILALEGILFLVGKFTGKGKSAIEDSAKKQQSKLLKQMQVSGAAFARQSAGVDKLNKSINYFDQAIKNWKQVIKDQLPVLPRQGLGQIGAGVEKVIKLYGLQGEAANKLRFEMETVRQVYSKGGRATLGELRQAQTAMSILGETLKGALPESKDLHKSLKAVTEGIGNFRENSDAMATALMHFQIGTQDYKKALKDRMLAAEAHIKTLMEAGKLEKGALAWMHKSGMSGMFDRTDTSLGKAQMEMLDQWTKRMGDTQAMLGEQTEDWKKLAHELAMFQSIVRGGREEVLKQIGKKAASRKEQRQDQRWNTLRGPEGASPASAGAGGAGGAAAAAARSPNQNIATVASNSTEMVKHLKVLSKTLVSMKSKGGGELESGDVRDGTTGGGKPRNG